MHPRIGRTAVAALLLLRAALALAEGPEPMKLLSDSREACRKVRDYAGTFTKREFLAGKLQNTEVLYLKFRQEPLSVYAKWVGEDHLGREAIYVKGRNEDMIVGHEFIGLLNVGKNMTMDGWEAKRNAREPITEGGMLNSIETFLRYVEMGQRNGDMQLRYIGIEPFDGKPAHVILRVMEKRPEYPAYMTFLYIDQERLLPVKSVGYDWDHKLLWLHTNVDLKLNVGLTDADFDPGNKEYNYPLLRLPNAPKFLRKSSDRKFSAP